MDLLTLTVLLVVSFALAVAGARSVLGLVLRLMSQAGSPVTGSPVTLSGPGSLS